MKWRRSKGFACRREFMFAKMNGYRMVVGKHQRVGDVWTPCDFFMAYIQADGQRAREFVGSSATLEGAQAACVLTIHARQEAAI